MILFLDQISQIFGLTQILQLIANYGYIAIFLLMFGESTFLPIPSELVLPFAGYLMVINAMDPVFGFADAVAAALIGSVVNYIIGYFFGMDVVLNYGRKMGFKMKHYELGMKWMRSYGIYFAFISKLLPIVRSAASLVCGALEMDFKKFVVYTSAGIMLWSAALISAGYALAKNWNQIYDTVSNIGIYIFIALAAAAIAYAAYLSIKRLFWRSNKKKRAKR